jgi:large subunit ribosomal protein L29
MTNSEIQKMSPEQLLSSIAAEEARYAKLKFSHAVAPLSNPMEIRNLRKHIARLRTALSSKAATLTA